MSSPIPEQENSRFLLFRDKFVIVEAVLNIIVQATAFTRVFLSTQRLKKSKSNRLPQNRVFFNHPNITACLNIECKKYKNLETKCVTTIPDLSYTVFRFVFLLTTEKNCFLIIEPGPVSMIEVLL